MQIIHTYPRAYVDWTCPLDDDGNEMGSCRDRADYGRYLDWLADYLYETNIPVPENQMETLAEFEATDGIRKAVFECSESLGRDVWETEGIESHFADGVPYEDYHRNQLECWNNLTEDEREAIGMSEEEYCTSEAEYIRIGMEKLDSQRVPQHIQHLDIPYRAIFAKLIKAEPNKEKRVAHLNYFFRNYHECASK